MTDEQIRAAAARIADANNAGLRERVFLCMWHPDCAQNTARLLLEVDRIVKYIQTGDTAAPSKAGT